MASVFVPLTVEANVIKIGSKCYQYKDPSTTPPDSTPDQEFEDCETCQETPTPTPTSTSTPTPTSTSTPTATPTPSQSADCSTCAANCDGAETITLVVSGVTGPGYCSSVNGIYTLTRKSACYWHWLQGGSDHHEVTVRCDGGTNTWSINVSYFQQSQFEVYCKSCEMVCSGDHPTGSGTLGESHTGCATDDVWSIS